MGYFGNIIAGIKTTAQGLSITGAYLGKNLKSGGNDVFALQYPDEKLEIDKVTHRGLHEYDVDRCISCQLCAKACPVDCIYIESVGKGKPAIMTRFEIDYSKCLFCSLCVPPCPSECIVLGEKYNLAGHSRDDMIVKFHEGVFPIQVKSDHAKQMVDEFESEGLFEKKKAKREENGVPTRVEQDPRKNTELK
jgi:NADH-quinone oxidoreductase subunit I